MATFAFGVNRGLVDHTPTNVNVEFLSEMDQDAECLTFCDIVSGHVPVLPPVDFVRQYTR